MRWKGDAQDHDPAALRQTLQGCAAMSDATDMHDRLVAAIGKSWRNGYQQAVDSLRELADELGDEQIKLAVAMLADRLQEMKP